METFKFYFFETCTLGKSVVLYSFDFFRDKNVFQTCTVLEYPPRKNLKLFWKRYGFETCAAYKSACFDIFEIIGEIDVFQSHAAVEGFSVYSYEAIGNVDSLQILAARKSSLADKLGAVGDINGFDVVHALKGRFSDNRDTVWYPYVLFGVAVVADKHASLYNEVAVVIIRCLFYVYVMRCSVIEVLDSLFHDKGLAAERAYRSVL